MLAGPAVIGHDAGVPVDLPPTYARGVRRRYADLPAAVRAWVEEQLGGPVTRVEDRVGGFAPGCAAVVATRAGAAFCKATSSVPNALALELYRGERARLAALPDHPAVPRPLAAVDLELPGEAWAVTLLPALPGQRRRIPGPRPWPGWSSTGWGTSAPL